MAGKDRLTEDDFDIDREFDDLNLDSLGDELPVSDLEGRDSARSRRVKSEQAYSIPENRTKGSSSRKKAHRRTSETLTTREKMDDLKSGFRIWAMDHTRLLIPIILGVLILIVVVIALWGHNKTVEKAAEESAQALTDATEETIPALEENAYPAVNELIRTYFDAYAAGDTDTIEAISSGLDDEEKIRIGELSKYIESYPDINVYTYPGPEEGSYVCFVVTNIKFKDQDTVIPGMQTMYVCTRSDGSLYINEDDSDEDSIAYIREISTQPEVVDLGNQIQEEYNSLMAEDPDLEDYVNDTYNKIQVAVAEALGNAESGSTGESDEEDSTEEDQSKVLRATDVINVRESDSEDAAIIGQTEADKIYPLIETLNNGWSTISFDGKTGYVKTEYFTEETLDTSTDLDADTDEDAEESNEAGSTASSKESTEPVGTAMALETVSIRKSASTDSEKLGSVWGGFTVNVLEKGDTWTKVDDNGTVGYIKTEYLQFN